MRSLYTEDIEGTPLLIKALNLNQLFIAKNTISKNIRIKSREVPGILIKVHSTNGLYLFPKDKNLTTPGSLSEIPLNLSANILDFPVLCTTKVSKNITITKIIL